MKFLVVLEVGRTATSWPSARLAGLRLPGPTEEEALANIREAIQGIVAVRQKHGLPIPEERVVEIAVPA